MSRFGRIPDDTALYNASDFAEDFVKQSGKQSADDTCARSSICPEKILSASSEAYELFPFALANE